MCIASMNCIKKARQNPITELPVRPNKCSGVNWALISAVAILAAAILAALTISQLVFTGLLLGSPLAIVGGVATAALTAFATVEMVLIARQCILNAHHHLKKNDSPTIQNGRIVRT